MWYPETRAIEILNRTLPLPASGREQDWDIELSDYNRIDEFIRFYRLRCIDFDVKMALAALIISSFEDSKWDGKFDLDRWREALHLFVSDFKIVDPVLQKWIGDGPEGDFAISEEIRRLRALALGDVNEQK